MVRSQIGAILAGIATLTLLWSTLNNRSGLVSKISLYRGTNIRFKDDFDLDFLNKCIEKGYLEHFADHEQLKTNQVYLDSSIPVIRFKKRSFAWWKPSVQFGSHTWFFSPSKHFKLSYESQSRLNEFS